MGRSGRGRRPPQLPSDTKDGATEGPGVVDGGVTPTSLALRVFHLPKKVSSAPRKDGESAEILTRD